jgi:hypothetical protein
MHVAWCDVVLDLCVDVDVILDDVFSVVLGLGRLSISSAGAASLPSIMGLQILL